MVFETIREFLCEQLACDESRVTPDTVMLEDLEMEPSDLGDLMLSLEQEFGIEWTDDDLQGIRTVGDLTAFVENQDSNRACMCLTVHAGLVHSAGHRDTLGSAFFPCHCGERGDLGSPSGRAVTEGD